MKELTIEEKAKAYDELLKKLQKAKVDNNVCDERYCCVIDDIVPELKESEDEKIRKGLIDFVNQYGDNFYGQISKEYALAWLEKQGEQKYQYKSRPRYVGEEELLVANKQGEQILANSAKTCKDLEEAGKEWLRPQLDKSYEKYGENKMMELTHFDGYSMLEAIEFGAKWKEEQFEKNRLEHCNSITNEQAELEQKFLDEHLDKHDRMPTFLDAIEYGMRLQKEQMMEQAVDAGCFGFQGAALFSFRLPSDRYLVGSKVKVIVIKED